MKVLVLLLLIASLCTGDIIFTTLDSEENENITRPMEFPLDHSKIIFWTDTLVDVLGISAHCYRCYKQPLVTSVFPRSEIILPPIDCTTTYDIEIINGFWQTSLANITVSCGDRGVYKLKFEHLTNGTINVEFSKLLSPINPSMPLIIGGSVIFFAIIIAYISQCIIMCAERRKKHRAPPQYASLSSGSGAYDSDIVDPLLRAESGVVLNGSVPALTSLGQQQQKPPRVISLDTFRGLTIAVMIFVNHGAGGYWFLRHSSWNGLGMADFVFPWFTWIMGASIALSLKAASRSNNSTKLQMLKKIIIRTIELFAIGLFMNNGFDVFNWRIPGVLQRLAISYFFAVLIGLFIPKLLCCTKQRTKAVSVQDGRELIGNWSPFRDICPYLLEYAIVFAIIAAHESITFGFNVPNCGRGYLGPGGIGDEGKFFNCTGGAAGYIDKLIFGENHIYQWPTCQNLYLTGSFDPEGILGCLTSIVQCYLGLQAGRTLVNFSRHSERLIRWIVWGLLLCAVGFLLSYAKIDGGLIPINKNLWSISFVCLISGFGFLALALCYFLVDVIGIWNGHPFKVIGMNSITIYILAELFVGFFPFSFASPNTHAWKLTQCLICVALWIIVSYVLYFKKIFIALG